MWNFIEGRSVNPDTVSSEDPHGFGLYHPPALVKRGFARFKATGVIPTRQQVEETDPFWEHDILELAHQERWLEATNEWSK